MPCGGCSRKKRKNTSPNITIHRTSSQTVFKKNAKPTTSLLNIGLQEVRQRKNICTSCGYCTRNIGGQTINVMKCRKANRPISSIIRDGKFKCPEKKFS